ncbi:MAG: hypothetical protein M3463_06320 [Verrucomicrobiota bacterium]|nr:hypothetical protein [Verrucomicrobiota bacterium]
MMGVPIHSKNSGASALFVIIAATAVLAQGQENPQMAWIYDFTARRGGTGTILAHQFEYAADLEEPTAYNRVKEIVTQHSSKSLHPSTELYDAVYAAVTLLAVTARDDAVEALAPYLHNAEPDLRWHATYILGLTKDRKAVPHLIGALEKVQNEMPRTFEKEDTTLRDKSRTLKACIRSLLQVGGDEANAAIDRTLHRLDASYSDYENGKKYVESLYWFKETGRSQNPDDAVSLPLGNAVTAQSKDRVPHGRETDRFRFTGTPFNVFAAENRESH